MTCISFTILLLCWLPAVGTHKRCDFLRSISIFYAFLEMKKWKTFSFLFYDFTRSLQMMREWDWNRKLFPFIAHRTLLAYGNDWLEQIIYFLLSLSLTLTITLFQCFKVISMKEWEIVSLAGFDDDELLACDLNKLLEISRWNNQANIVHFYEFIELSSITRRSLVVRHSKSDFKILVTILTATSEFSVTTRMVISFSSDHFSISLFLFSIN